MGAAHSWPRGLAGILARLVAALFLGGFLTAWGAEWSLSEPPMFPVVLFFFGLLPLGVTLFRRNHLVGVLFWLVCGLNVAGTLCWMLFQWDFRGPLLGSDLAILIAANIGPTWGKRWLVALGCGVASGLGAVLALWVGSLLLYYPGIVDLAFVGNALLLGAVVGLVGEALRRAVERQTLDLQGGPLLPSAGLPRRARGPSRREVVFGLGGVMGLAATGVGATWLMRTLWPHFRPLVSYEGAWGGAISTLSWSPDGRKIVSASRNAGGVRLWDATTGRILQFADQLGAIGKVAWSPDGKQIVITVVDVGHDQAPNVFLVDAATLQPTGSLRAPSSAVSDAAWSPDSARLAIAMFHVQVWDVSTEKVLWTTSEYGWRVTWSPDGAYLATADSDGTCQVWEAGSGHLLTTYHGHKDGVWAIAWSPDSRLIASGGLEAPVQVWEALTGRLVYTYRDQSLLGSSPGILTVAWSPQGQRIASGGGAGGIHVWEATTGAHVFVYAGQEDLVNVVAWSPDGSKIASGGVRGIVQVWQPE